MLIRNLKSGRYNLRTIIDDELILECIIEVYKNLNKFSILETTIIDADWKDTNIEPDVLHSTLKCLVDYEVISVEGLGY